MRFTNTTPLAAHLSIGRELPNGLRAGLVLAKATFAFDERGRLRLDDQDPMPLFDADKETPLGLLPRDNMPRNDAAFEVFLLGKAHAPFGKPVPHVRVGLTVGDTKRELDVYGNRFWVGTGPGAVLSAPEPFLEMPLTYSRAFGGTADIEVDVDSPIEVTHPDNPEGVGFDLEPIAASLHAELNCPAGFPRYARERAVPNIEAVGSPLKHWSDTPEPELWSAVPLGSAIHNRRCYRVEGEGATARVHVAPGHLHRAHPSVGPSMRARGRARPSEAREHLTRGGTVVTLRFPQLEVHLDYVLGDRGGSRALAPRALVLLPEEHRITLALFHAFPGCPADRCRSRRLSAHHGDPLTCRPRQSAPRTTLPAGPTSHCMMLCWWPTPTSGSALRQ